MHPCLAAREWLTRRSFLFMTTQESKGKRISQKPAKPKNRDLFFAKNPSILLQNFH
jgi:hypothetical protein